VGALDITKAPFAGSSALPDSFLDETIEFWQPRSEKVLTREDAREMIENMTGFFNILNEWYAAEQSITEKCNETSLSSEASLESGKQLLKR
jgi:hypothetical protein